MKIYTLTENTPFSDDFIAEHGLSLYIETKNHKILFDTGASDAFSKNASTLGIDLSKVDLAFLSHGHYDHGGGLEKFLELNQTAPIYLNQYAFGDYYNATSKYIGLDKKLYPNDRFIFVKDFLKIDEELSIFSCNDLEKKYPLDTAGLSTKKDNERIPEKFLHEQYLTILEENKKVLISGCSHKGILNIMNWFQPDCFIGGFHFMKQEIKENRNQILDYSAEILNSYHIPYYTCHCTGIEQYNYLKKKMGNQLHYLSAGSYTIL